MLAKGQKKIKSKEGMVFQVLFLILAIFLIWFLITSNLKIRQKRAEMTSKIESLKKEIQILEEEKQKLQAGISETGKESYWEEKIRQEGYIKEGENPVVVLPPKEEKVGKEEKNIWNPQNWWEWIKNLLRD